MIRQRASARVATSLLGTLVFNEGESISTCLIRDYSEGGARLWVSGELAIPERFELRIQRTGQSHEVELRWRTGDEVGVAFRRPGPRLIRRSDASTSSLA